MKEYEIVHETINPCGGEAHKDVVMEERMLESPEAFVRAQHPQKDCSIQREESRDSEVWKVFFKGVSHKYTFSEV